MNDRQVILDVLNPENYAVLVRRAWGDAEFKARLLTDPAPAMAELGLETPSGKDVKFVENTADVAYLVLPFDSSEVEFGDSDLAQADRGKKTKCGITPCCKTVYDKKRA